MAFLPQASTPPTVLYSLQLPEDTQPEIMRLLAERGSQSKAWAVQAAQLEADKRQLEQQLEGVRRALLSSQAEMAHVAQHAEAVRARAAQDDIAHQQAVLLEVERSVALTTDLQAARDAQVESTLQRIQSFRHTYA